MSRWRIYTVLALMVVPVLILTAYGGYALWKEFWWGAWIWVPMTVSMAVGWFLAWFWQRNKTLLRPVNFEPNVHWTERDQQAWKLVQARAGGQGHRPRPAHRSQTLPGRRPRNGPGDGRLLPPQGQGFLTAV